MKCSICNKEDDNIHYDTKLGKFTDCVECESSVKDALLSFIEDIDGEEFLIDPDLDLDEEYWEIFYGS